MVPHSGEAWVGSCLDYSPVPSRGAPPLPHLCSLAPFLQFALFLGISCLPSTKPTSAIILSVCLPPTPPHPSGSVSVLPCFSPRCLGLIPSLSTPYSLPPPTPSLSLSPLVAPVVWTSSAPFCPDDLTSPPHAGTHTLTVTHKYKLHTHMHTLWSLAGFPSESEGPQPQRWSTWPGPRVVENHSRALHLACTLPGRCTAVPQPPPSNLPPISPWGCGGRLMFQGPPSTPQEGLANSTVPHPPLCLLRRDQPWPGSWKPGSSWLSLQHPGGP